MRTDPTFVTDHPELPGNANGWSANEWRAYLQALPRDSVAIDAWLKKSEVMTADAVAVSGATLSARAESEWRLFGRYFRWASARQRVGETVDWDVFARKFEAHASKYAEAEVISTHAEDYMGALQMIESERSGPSKISRSFRSFRVPMGLPKPDRIKDR